MARPPQKKTSSSKTSKAAAKGGSRLRTPLAIVAFLVLVLVAGVLMYPQTRPLPDLPRCDSPQLAVMAAQSLRRSPEVKKAGLEVETVSPGQEVSSNDRERVCSAIIKSKQHGDEAAVYKLTWDDRKEGIFGLKFLPLKSAPADDGAARPASKPDGSAVDAGR
jgi:hypothetical protein